MFNKELKGAKMVLEVLGRAAYIVLGIVVGVWLVVSGVII
jgi:hypothetical protein